MTTERKALLLIGSAKSTGQSSSEALGTYLLEQLAKHGFSSETYHVHQVLRTRQRFQELLIAVNQADLLILACPLYVDSLPYLVTNALELIAAHRQAQKAPGPCQFVAILNCGFPEAQHNDTALAICGQFARQAQLGWQGGLALGQGGTIGGRPLAQLGGMGHSIVQALDLTASALAQGRSVPAEAVALMAKPLMPNFFYTLMAHLGWRMQARQQGTWGHLQDRPFVEQRQP